MIGIIGFGLGRYFRSISTWVYFVLLASIAFLFMIAAGGAFQSASVGFGDKVMLNSPYTLAASIAVISYFGLLIVSAIAGKAGIQDFQNDTHSLFFTLPISKWSYLGGRFAAALAALVVIFSAIALGFALGTAMPFIDRTRIAPNHLWPYVQPYLISVIPNLLLMGALFFSMAALTRRILPVYMVSVILLIGYLIATTLSAKLEDQYLASLLDPFGQLAMGRLTQYWTIAEKNTRSIPLEGAFLWNRVLWMGVAIGLAAYTYVRFRFVYALEGRKLGVSRIERAETKSAGTESAGPKPGGSPEGLTPQPSAYHALLRLSWLGFTETVKNIYFAVIVLAGILFMVLAARTAGSLYGTPTYPVTYQMTELIGGAFALFNLIIITFYSGELIWRERDAKTHELVDILPVPNRVLFLSKLFALFLVEIALACVVMLTGIAIQLFNGYTRLEPTLYIKQLFGLDMIGYWLLCVLAITVHTLVNNKYLGHFVMVLFYLAGVFLSQIGLEHHLYLYGSSPDITYSDMNGFGHFVRGVLWFDAYWAAWAVLLALIAHLFLVRGLATEARWRFTLARLRFDSTEKRIAAGSIVAFAALGAFIYYNTNILHIYRTSKQNDMLRVRYEKQYKKYRGIPEPRITAVKLNVSLDPARHSVKIQGHYDLTNKNSQAVDRVVVDLLETLQRRIAFAPATALESDDRSMDTAIYRFTPPLAPGATASLDFEVTSEPRGFSNNEAPSGDILGNGTFINSGLLPHFGYRDDAELGDDGKRRKNGLPPKERVADLNDAAARRNNALSSDADWISFDAVVSTSADQIAVAPGELVREWSEPGTNKPGRHYFEYRTSSQVLNFWSVVSARYRVLRDHWNDVALAIYYQPGHEYNLATMMKGMKAALAYCTTNFSPYQAKTLRIMEFPRYASFAQSFPTAIPYSESIGFIARVDPKSDKDVDYPLYVTAHETGHQWWGHQVVPGNVQGASMVVESLAQYTAMMVMKHEVGADQMRRFLKYEMDRYLLGRALERKKELPLERVETQPYIYYNKGSVVLYALQDYLGEETVNRVLREYLQSAAYQQPPYTNARELVDRLRKVTPPDLAYLVDDMFESITLYENRALSATWRQTPQGKYEIKLKVAARKVKAGELGDEHPARLADWIDIGVLDDQGKPLYLEKRKIEQPETEFTLLVDRKPAKAGIDPWNELVDRKPDDNVINVTKQ